MGVLEKEAHHQVPSQGHLAFKGLRQSQTTGWLNISWIFDAQGGEVRFLLRNLGQAHILHPDLCAASTRHGSRHKHAHGGDDARLIAAIAARR